MKKLIIIFISGFNLLFNPSVLANSQIGGKWHKETVDAWKEFNRGKDTSEISIEKYFEISSFEKLKKFYEVACKYGSAGFCLNLGYDTKNKKKRSSYFIKSCEIANDLDHCEAAMISLLEIDKFIASKDIFLKYCNDPNVLEPRCTSYIKGSVSNKFVRMLKLACKEDSKLACKLLKDADIKP